MPNARTGHPPEARLLSFGISLPIWVVEFPKERPLPNSSNISCNSLALVMIAPTLKTFKSYLPSSLASAWSPACSAVTVE